MIGMNLAGGLQALGLEGAGAFSGRDKAVAFCRVLGFRVLGFRV